MTKLAATTMADTAARRNPLYMTPPLWLRRNGGTTTSEVVRAAVQDSGPIPKRTLLYTRQGAGILRRIEVFVKRKRVSASVRLDRDPVVHLIDAQDLSLPAVAAE